MRSILGTSWCPALAWQPRPPSLAQSHSLPLPRWPSTTVHASVDASLVDSTTISRPQWWEWGGGTSQQSPAVLCGSHLTSACPPPPWGSRTGAELSKCCVMIMMTFVNIFLPAGLGSPLIPRSRCVLRTLGSPAVSTVSGGGEACAGPGCTLSGLREPREPVSLCPRSEPEDLGWAPRPGPCAGPRWQVVQVT